MHIWTLTPPLIHGIPSSDSLQGLFLFTWEIQPISSPKYLTSQSVSFLSIHCLTSKVFQGHPQIQRSYFMSSLVSGLQCLLSSVSLWCCPPEYCKPAHGTFHPKADLWLPGSCINSIPLLHTAWQFLVTWLLSISPASFPSALLPWNLHSRKQNTQGSPNINCFLPPYPTNSIPISLNIHHSKGSSKSSSAFPNTPRQN